MRGPIKFNVVYVAFADLIKVYCLQEVDDKILFFSDINSEYGKSNPQIVERNSQVDAEGNEIESFLELPGNFASELVTAIINAGIKPVKEFEIKATLEAKEEHLKDTKEQLGIVNGMLTEVIKYRGTLIK